MNNLCTLPKKMEPNKETFETLGFSFLRSKDDKMYWASLPNGWDLKLSSPLGGVINILDSTGHKRGTYDYKHACMSIV